MKSKTYYVYVDCCVDTGIPFYVGKGSLRRTKDFTRRNHIWYDIVIKHNVNRSLVFETDNEQLALNEEVRLIRELKTRDYLGGANMDDGGRGVKGYKHTPHAKAILSNLSKERLNSPEERRKASEKFLKMWQENREQIMKTHVHGITHPKSKLTEFDVREIRKAYDSLDKSVRGTMSRFFREWAEKLNVTPENLFRVVHYKSWTHF